MRAPCVRGGAARRGASMQGDGRSAAAASHLLAHAGELAARAGCDAVLEVVEQAEAVVLHREHPLAAGGRRVHRSPTLEAPPCYKEANAPNAVGAVIVMESGLLVCALHCHVLGGQGGDVQIMSPEAWFE